MDKSPDELIRAYQVANASYHQAYDYLARNIMDLCQVDDSRVPELIITALEDPNPYLRHAACCGLRLRRDFVSNPGWDVETTRYLPILRRILDNGKLLPFNEDADATGMAIASVGGLDEIDTLLNALQHSHLDVRASAQAGLLMLLVDESAALPFVVRRLKSDNIRCRVGAASVLCMFRDDFKYIVVEQLVEGLQFVEHRPHFVRLLGDIGDPNLAPTLIPLLSDNSGGSRYYDYPIRVKHQAQEALRKMDDAAIPVLQDALTSEDDEIREMVVFTLNRIASPKAVSIINSLIQHPDAVLRDAAKRVIDGNPPDPWLEHVYPVPDNLHLG